MNKRLIRKLLAEFVGTCFLVMIVIGSGIMAQNLSSDQLTTRQEFLTTRLTLIEAASQVHLSKTEIETLTGLALKTEHNDDSMHSSHQDNLQQSSNISIRSHDYE